jgi:hypothetical protein
VPEYVAGDLIRTDQLGERPACQLPALYCITIRSPAGLIAFGCVDVQDSDALAANVNCVAINDDRTSADG